MTERRKAEEKMLWFFEKLVEAYEDYDSETGYLSLTYFNRDGKKMFSIDNGVEHHKEVNVCKWVKKNEITLRIDGKHIDMEV